MRRPSTLLGAWGLLQERVVPSLLGVEGTPRSWSIGSVEDAVAVAVAARHPEPCGSHREIESFTSEGPAAGTEVTFAIADLRCLPASGKESFVRRQGRWVPDDQIAGTVLIGEPSEPVDLVTLRLDASAPGGVEEAVGALRRDGQLLLVGDGAGEVFPEGVEEIPGAQEGGKLYRKCSETRWRARRRAALPTCESLAQHRANEEMVERYIPLARSLARRYAHHGESMSDLEQVAYLALVKAAKRFDPQRDTRFATYATASILGELKRHFRDKTWMMRVPRPVQEAYLSVKHAREELTHALGTPPTVEQIAGRVGTSREMVTDALCAGDNFWPTSLDGGKNREAPAIEVAVTDAALERSLDRLQLQQLLPRLDHRERVVLKRVFLDSCTQREVAAELGVSQMQVSRLLARAVAKLRA